ncbi:MAG: hypothetical protein U9Q77_04875 [Candidatus Marinimicrobia bacterium]|nr:hypothetical protein [Candidatus Neomarinimicrobiota bacterium]
MILPFGFSLETEFHGGLLPFIGLALVMILFVFMTNRRRTGAKGLGKHQLGLILFLRISVVILLLLLVFDPEVSLNRVRTLPKRIAVILDQSQSMSKAWKGSTLALEESIVEVFDDLNQIYEVELWSLDGEPLEPGDFNFEAESSVFSWSPDLGTGNKKQDIYAAVFIISDGQLNGGRSPIDMTWTKNIPLYPILPLKMQSNTQLKLLDLNYEIDDNSESSVQVKLKIQENGLEGKVVTVIIQDQYDEVVGEKSFRLSNIFTDISIPVRLAGTGSRDLTVTLKQKDGNLRTKKLLTVELSRSYKTVLLLSERVNALHKFLLLHLPDSSFQVHTSIGTTIGQGAAGNGVTFPDDFDLIILNQPGDQIYNNKLIDVIASELKDSCPLIIFHDNSAPLDAQWLKLMGLQQHQNSIIPSAGTPFWSESAKGHPLYLGLLGLGFSPVDMIKYPPITRGKLDLQSPGSDLLVIGRAEQQSSAFNLSDNPPMAIFSGSGYWKWFFHPQTRPSFEMMWEYLLLYLEDIAHFKPLVLDVPVKTANTGDYVEIGVSVSDIDGRAIQNAEVRVWQQDGQGDLEELDLTQDPAGEYRTGLMAKYPGETMVIAEAYRFGELWGRDTSTIQLAAFNVEDQSEGVDEVFLERLARRSGGRVIHLEQDKLPAIPVSYYPQHSANTLKGVRSPGLFVMLVTLLVVEWILRRRNGLL